MKQIPLLQGKALLIELPEGAHSVQDSHANGFIYKLPDGYVESWYADEDGGLDGNWRVIGMLSEVTEEQAIPLVERESKPEYSYEQKYPEYVGDEWWYRDYQAQDDSDYKYSHYTALESLESAIRAEGWYFENPVPPFHERADEWKEAQSRVLCRERCFVLRRTDI